MRAWGMLGTGRVGRHRCPDYMLASPCPLRGPSVSGLNAYACTVAVAGPVAADRSPTRNAEQGSGQSSHGPNGMLGVVAATSFRS